MPVLDGVAATALLHWQLPASRVLMLTTFDDEEYVLEALRAGATGYLLKDIPGSELARAIRSVQAGLYQLDPAVASRVIANLNSPRLSESGQTPPPASGPARHPLSKIDLTEREIEILRLIACGSTNREIAQELVISEGTVKNHVSNILSRLELRDRTQAALFAREQGLL